MAPDRHAPEPKARGRTFLAERYRAGASRETARLEAEAARVAAIQLCLEGRSVMLLGSLLVPGDETVFSLFGAAARDDVAAVGERIGLPYDRISESVPVVSATTRADRRDFESASRALAKEDSRQLKRRMTWGHDGRDGR